MYKCYICKWSSPQRTHFQKVNDRTGRIRKSNSGPLWKCNNCYKQDSFSQNLSLVSSQNVHPDKKMKNLEKRVDCLENKTIIMRKNIKSLKNPSEKDVIKNFERIRKVWLTKKYALIWLHKHRELKRLKEEIKNTKQAKTGLFSFLSNWEDWEIERIQNTKNLEEFTKFRRESEFSGNIKTKREQFKLFWQFSFFGSILIILVTQWKNIANWIKSDEKKVIHKAEKEWEKLTKIKR